MPDGGTLEQLTGAIGAAVAALSDDLQSDRIADLLVELGLSDTIDLSGDPQFQQTLASGTHALEQLFPRLDALADAIRAADVERTIGAAADVRTTLATAIASLQALATDLRRAAAATSLAGEAASLADVLVERLLGYALICALERSSPALLGLLEILTIAERTATPVGSGATARTVLRRLVHYDRLSRLVSDAQSLLRDGYGWGTQQLQFDLLLERIARFLLAIGVLTGDALDDNSSPVSGLDLFVLTIGARTDISPAGLGTTITTSTVGSTTIPLYDPSPGWHLGLDLTGAFGEGLVLLLTPPAKLKFPAASTSAPGGAQFVLEGAASDAADPLVLIGIAGGSRVEAARVRVSVGATLSGTSIATTADGQVSADIVATCDVSGGSLVLSMSGADSFLSDALPGELRCAFDVGVTWSSEAGLAFRGSAGLDAALPVNLTIGPVTVPEIHIGLLAASTGLQAEVSASAGVSIGLVQALVDRVGMTLALTFPAAGGNLGAADLQPAFKPPSEVGLTVDASILTGGGFVGYEPATGRYSGVLDLHSEKIGITALGLIDTKLPGNRSGYSLLLALRATFPAIQIGLGFALTSVGGLLALNRKVNVDVLRSRLAAGTADRILSPQDPVRNAPALLADLEAVFPPTPGSTVVGPTAQLVWAGLVHFDIGVFIELPGPARVVLLGSAHAEIERDGRAYLSIRVDVVGVVDLRGETAAFDAVLVDSHLMGTLDVTGGAAFRLSWGAQPYAVLSLGGFNPAYHPEPLSFPATLTRIAMVHGKPSDELYLRFEGYFAITSNTLQFGASVEVAIRADPFTVHGSLSFDALIQFEPFHFQVDIRASVSVAYHGDTLAGLTLTGSLTGPGPVVLQAKVCIELLFFDICFSGTFTLGPTSPPPASVAADLLDLLTAELADPARLRAAGAPDPYVRLRPPDPSLTTPVVAPTGTVVWEQPRAPLDLLLTRVGGTPLPAPAQVKATTAAPAATTQADWFAPGQFTDLTDDQALTRPGYELLTSGLRLAGGGTVDGPSAQVTLTTKEILLPAKPTLPDKQVVMFPAWILTSAAGPPAPAVTVTTEKWIVTTPAGETAGLVGAQARQLAALTASARAVPAPDRLAPFAF